MVAQKRGIRKPSRGQKVCDSQRNSCFCGFCLAKDGYNRVDESHKEVIQMAVNKVNNDTFAKLVLNNGRTVLIDFYADWCGPCRQLSPVLDELAKEYSGKLTIYKVNVDNERGLATFFGIRSIPTLLFIPMKGKPQRSLGALSKTELKGIIKDVDGTMDMEDVFNAIVKILGE